MMKVTIVMDSVAAYPELDTWIRIEEDGTVLVFTGKVEIGQGIKNALARIVAEELDVPLEFVRVMNADTAVGPDEGITASSQSLQQTGPALTRAAAFARQLLFEKAADAFDCPTDRLRVSEGRIHTDDGRSVTYAKLMGGQLFETRIPEKVETKAPADYTLLGHSGPRLDLPDKLKKGGAYVADLRPPGLLFARVLRPPHLDAELLELDDAEVRKLPGVVSLVRDGRFIGVIAEREEQALWAREALADRAVWSKAPETLENAIETAFRDGARVSQPVNRGMPEDRVPDPHTDPDDAVTTLEAQYAKPFLLHAAIAPSAAIACEEDGMLTITTHSQGIGPTRGAVAAALDRPLETVRLIHHDGPGCYGHNGADDVTLDAAILAAAVPGRPVLLQWAREDENRWEPYGSAMRVAMRGSLNKDGVLCDWNHEATSFGHVSRPMGPETPANLSATWLRDPPIQRPPHVPWMRPEMGEHRNAWPGYEFPRTRVVKHLVTNGPLRTSSLRGLGAYANVFAIESFLDELALEANADPLEFRLRHLEDPRARAVLERAASEAGWPRPNQGLAYARYENTKAYAAVVVELHLDAGNRIVLDRCVIASDAGQVVDPESLVNQLEGGFVQSASWTLLEAVRFNGGEVATVDWETYPILGFADIPEIETHLINQPGAPFLGAGEATAGPTPAAIANALFRHCGARLRETPFTPERVSATRSQ